MRRTRSAFGAIFFNTEVHRVLFTEAHRAIASFSRLQDTEGAFGAGGRKAKRSKERKEKKEASGVNAFYNRMVDMVTFF